MFNKVFGRMFIFFGEHTHAFMKYVLVTEVRFIGKPINIISKISLSLLIVIDFQSPTF